MPNDSTANNTQLVRHQLHFAPEVDAQQLVITHLTDARKGPAKMLLGSYLLVTRWLLLCEDYPGFPETAYRPGRPAWRPSAYRQVT